MTPTHIHLCTMRFQSHVCSVCSEESSHGDSYYEYLEDVLNEKLEDYFWIMHFYLQACLSC